jgi:hypothetical protein
VHSDSFSVRWTGTVLAPVGGVYTFYANTNDGAQLWVNGRQIINQWVAQPLTETGGDISLQAGQRYPIRFEYFENVNTAQAELRWSCNGLAKQIIPKADLFPPDNATAARLGRTIGAGKAGHELDLSIVRLSNGLPGVEATIQLRKPAKIHVSVYSVKGKVVEVLAEGMASVGEHRFVWNPGRIPAGIYIVNLRTTDGNAAALPVSLLR